MFVSATSIKIEKTKHRNTLDNIWYCLKFDLRQKPFVQKWISPAAVHGKCESLGEGTAATPAVYQTSKSARLPPWLMPAALADAFRHHEGFLCNLHEPAARLWRSPRAISLRWVDGGAAIWEADVFNHRLSLCHATICQINTRTQNPAFIFLTRRENKNGQGWWSSSLNNGYRGRRTAAWRTLDLLPFPRSAGELFGRQLGSFRLTAWQKVLTESQSALIVLRAAGRPATAEG